MSRYIDAEWLIAELKTVADRPIQSQLYIVRQAPSIDIVRCKECIRANHELSGIYCGLSDVNMGEDGFCSYGVRLE